ncbi:MAG: hypothetical protein Q4G64_00260 [bacterium]|nr:hypothetical protein [bacterium]
MAHLRSLLSFDRTDLEFLLLLASGWDQADLRPRAFASRRVGVIMGGGEPELGISLRIAAHATSVELFEIESALARDLGRGREALTGAIDAIVLADPQGAHVGWYSQEAIPVINLTGPSGAPLEVVARLHSRLSGGARLRGTTVVWEGAGAPALTSWVEATGDLPIHVTQVAGDASISRSFLARLRSEGQVGTFDRASRRPEAVDIDARARLSVRSRACAIAAALEFGLHTNR